MSAAILLLAAGGLALVAFSRSKSKTAAASATDPELESKMIGTELATLPEESRNHIMRLLLTDNPENDSDVYMGAVAQLSALGTFPFTAAKLTQIAKDRFGA